MEPEDLNKAKFMEHPIVKHLLDAGAAIEPSDPEVFHMEEAPAPLPVDIQSRETPGGVPLHEILGALQGEVPGLRALQVRDRRLMLTYGAPPSDEDRGKIARVLSDPASLTSARPASLATPGTESDPGRLLRDPAISDQDWLHAFREYAVKFLITGGA